MPFKNKDDKLAYKRRIRKENRQGKKSGLVCISCGKSLALGKRKYCSGKCGNAYYDKNIRDIERTRGIRKKYNSHFISKLRDKISKRIKRILVGKQHSFNYSNGVICYTENQLKQNLEKQFKNGMTWGNYGVVWHIDHKIPVSAFNLTCSEDVKRCWALDNLQPLFAGENLRKSNTLERPFQPLLI
jgi:hypothetical protein